MLSELRDVWKEIGLDIKEQEQELERQLKEFYEYKLMDAHNMKGQLLDDISTMEERIETFSIQLGEQATASSYGSTLNERLARVQAKHDALKQVENPMKDLSQISICRW